MFQKLQERIRCLSEGKRCVISFIAGAAIFLFLYYVSLEIYKVSGLHLNEKTEYLIALYPVFLCIISCLLNDDLKVTITACIGASINIIVPFCLDGNYIFAFVTCCLFAFHGFCLYHGRKAGWRAAILRTLCLLPTFGEAFSSWDGRPITFKVLIFMLGLICYVLIGRKNVLKIEGVIMFFVAIILSALNVTLLPNYIIFLLLNPNYYP